MKLNFLKGAFVFLSFLMTFQLKAGAETAPLTRLKWLGHSAFQINTPRNTILIIDPWLSNPMNPEFKTIQAKMQPKMKGGDTPQLIQALLETIPKCDYILLTHGHADHVGETVSLAKKTRAHLVANFELGQNLVKVLGLPKELVGYETLGNPGGELVLAEGEIKVHFVPAVHSSGLDVGKENEAMVYGGTPVGFVIQIKQGPTFYHSGDTAYFTDMSLIGKNFHPDVALLNIGGHFGMEPSAAAEAANTIKPKLVIPHHFKTMPVITQSPESFLQLLDQKKLDSLEMQPGQTIEFEGVKLKKGA